MRVFNNLQQLPKFKNSVITTGTFDGVHLGHLKIIERLKQIAQNTNGETVIVTFYPHPRMVLFPEDNDLKLLNTQDEKIKLLQQSGIENLIVAVKLGRF